MKSYLEVKSGLKLLIKSLVAESFIRFSSLCYRWSDGKIHMGRLTGHYFDQQAEWEYYVSRMRKSIADRHSKGFPFY